MDLELSEEQSELRATVTRFLDDHAPITPYVREMVRDPRGTTDAVWKGLAELGVLGMLAPAEHGGSGMGMVEMGVVLEAVGRRVHPGPLLSTAVAAVSALNELATSEEQADLLPGLASGQTVATLALVGPAGHVSLGRPGVEAKLTSSGWRLDGEKSIVADGAGADLLFLTASTVDGMGLFAVDPKTEGVATTPLGSVDGTRKQATLNLTGVSARKLGTGDITSKLQGVVDRVLAAYAADGVGTAERAMEMAVDHARERIQFDRPVGSFQAVQHLCSDMLQAVELARAGTGYALWALDAADPAEAHRAATMAKAFTSEALPRVGSNAIQVLGGIGFTWEHDVHLYYKRLLTLQQVHGGPAVHLEELASQIL